MGWQIGLVCAKSGYNVRLHDIRSEAMESARHHQAAKLDELDRRRRVGRAG